MHQIGLVPSGCHFTGKSILHISENYLLYASTLAIYVLNANTFVIEKIISANEKSIISTALSPHDSNLIAVASLDGKVNVWNIERQDITARVVLQAQTRMQLAWSPHDASTCAIVTSDPHIRVLLWDVFKPQSNVVEIFAVKTDKLAAVSAKWNPHTMGILAFGCTNGCVILFMTATKTQRILQPAENDSPVVDIQWDRLSSVYLLVAYQYHVILWDAERREEIQRFEKQMIPITSLAWLDWTAGNFITTNAKSGVVKVWNASQKQPLESQRLGNVGINNITVNSESHRAMCSCSDGSLLVYNMMKRQIEFLTAAGHAETIFDCQFHPKKPECLATASFDGTIKLWDVPTLGLTATISGANEIIYSCDWSPSGGQLACSTVSGAVIFYDVETTNELARFVHHTKQSYCVAWCKLVDDQICSTSADGNVVLFRVRMEELYELLPTSAATGSRVKSRAQTKRDSDIRMKFTHPAPVFGCVWHPKIGNIFTTCCQDGKVRIFNSAGHQTPILVLEGHNARSFNCVWSPILPHILASGSDDQTILIWEIHVESDRFDDSPEATRPTRRLIGHTGYVRALSWSYEINGLLLSGSWDSTIKLWDAFTGNCLYTCEDHIADVYSVVSHPDNPFCFVSCSRDTTLRIWELDGCLDALKASAVFEKNFDSLIATEPVNVLSGTSGAFMRTGNFENNCYSILNKLCGQRSKVVNRSLQHDKGECSKSDESIDKVELARNYNKIFNFLSGSSGVGELWRNVISILQGSTSSESNSRSLTVPEAEVTNAMLSQARILESIRMNNKRTDLSGKVEEQLRAAALLYAKCGNLEKYCTLMVDLGDWNAALAVAPAVSFKFWNDLSLKYAKHLSSLSNENAIPYYIATSSYFDAIEFTLKRKELDSAMVIAKLAESAAPSTTSGNNWAAPDSTSSSNGSKQLVAAVSVCAANTHLTASRPLIAAAQHVAVKDIDLAIKTLNASEHYEVSLALAKCFELDCDEISVLLANKVARKGYVEVAIEILNGRDLEIGLLLSRYVEREDEIRRYCDLYGLRSLGYWADRAAEEESMGSDCNAAVAYVISRQFSKAVALGMQILKRNIREPLDMSEGSKLVLRSLKYVDGLEIAEQVRSVFMCYMFWFCAHEAAEQGLWEVACSMLSILETHIISKQVNSPITADEVHLQLTFFKISCGEASAMQSISELESRMQLPTETSDSFKSLKSLLRDASLRNMLANSGKGESQSSKLQAICDRPGFALEDMVNENSRAGVWGVNTAVIFREIQRVSNAMSLPSLSKLHQKSFLHRAAYFSGNMGSVAQGSLLPAANQALKSHVSCITKQKIQGRSYQIPHSQTSEIYASYNEVLNWRMVNPFSPAMDGTFL